MRVKEGNKEKDILEAAIKIFAESGYHKSKISKIADTAGVAIGSVYVYFKNKEDILLTIFSKLWKELYNNLQEIVKNDSLSNTEKFDSLIDLVFDSFSEDPELALVFVNEQNHIQKLNEKEFTKYYKMFLDIGEDIIRDGISKGEFSEYLDIKILRQFFWGAIRHLIRCWANDAKEYPLNRTRRSVKVFVKRGIEK